MRFYCSFIFVFFVVFTQAQTLCENGYAGVYPCENVDLIAHVPPSQMGGGTTNEVWGWTDPLDGKEYVLLGKSNGVAFFDIENPLQPLYLGYLPTHSSNSLWRTLRTYNNYLFVGSEANNHGLQVFDLTQLRNVPNPPMTFSEDAHYAGFGRCHTLVIEESTGMLYACGTNTFLGGLHIVNIQNPLQPVIAGSYDLDGYTHEAQVMVYNGPDPDYLGHTVVFCYNGNNPAALTLVDVTDPTDTQTISITYYPNSAYCHQGWLTPDGRYLLMDDELDEYNSIFTQTRTLIWNVEDLDAPEYLGDFLGTTEAIDHNQYIIGNLAFQSNYTAGFRLIDVTDIDNMNLQEVGYFDHYPVDNDNVFESEWMNYPYFESGIIPLTDIDNGMFLVKPNFTHLIQLNINVCQLESAAMDVVLHEGFIGPITTEIQGLPEGVAITTSPLEPMAGDTIHITLSNWPSSGVFSGNVVLHGLHFSYDRPFTIAVNEPIEAFVDSDNDGYGLSVEMELLCELEEGYSIQAGDCNDSNATVYPGASGIGEGIDNNCDGMLSSTETNFCADLDNDDLISVNDFVIFVSQLECTENCMADFNQDGIVNLQDLFILFLDFAEYCD